LTPGWLRVDMHLHTHRSFDSLNEYGAILAAARARGIDRLVITDHNDIRGALELRERAPEMVLVGEEVKTREGFDVIGIFLRERIPKGTPALETCMAIRAQGGIVYLPHPFDRRGPARAGMLDRLAELVDVIEVHNPRCWPISRNARAAAWAEARGKLMGAGSDAHTIREIGRGFVEVPEFTADRDSFLSALARASVNGISSTSPLMRIASNWAKLRKVAPFRPRLGPGA